MIEIPLQRYLDPCPHDEFSIGQTNMSQLTVVLSQAPGKHPAKRGLEEALAAALLFEPNVHLSIVPNVYDLGPDHTGRIFLEGVKGNMVILSWHYPRAVFWLLDRIGIKGHSGQVLLKPADQDEEEADESETPAEPKGIGAAGDIPDRYIYCLDLRDRPTHEPYLEEIRRIVAECQTRDAQKNQQRALQNAPLIQLGLPAAKPVSPVAASPFTLAEPSSAAPSLMEAFTPEKLLAPTNRRWYPVIDYSRCTNCLECLDFCLFGVYGVDEYDRLFVETQDNCKKGCPACSRVCPEQAIMFPEYKSPAIAGAPVGAVGAFKIDLSKLFGGDDKDALTQAIEERDRELIADGRGAVGATVGIPKRQANKPATPKDDLDKLMDDLDALEL